MSHRQHTSLGDFLSRDNVRSGQAVENAESHLEFLRNAREINETLPKAWEQLVAAPDEILVELLDEKVKELSGRKAGPDRVKHFLASLGKSDPAPLPPIAPPPPQPKPDPPSVVNYTGSQPERFSFNGQTHTVNSWAKLLTTLAEQIHKLHPTEFDKALELRGTTRSYFSRSGQGMSVPRPVGTSGYYAETKMDANRIVTVCHRLLAKFGYREQDLEIKVTEAPSAGPPTPPVA